MRSALKRGALIIKIRLIIFFLIIGAITFLSLNRKEEFYLNRSLYGSFVQDPLNAGLPLSLRGMRKSVDVIYLIVHKPKLEMDYRSPKKLRDSLFLNSTDNLNVGHVQLAWSCEVDNKRYESAFGFTGELNSQALHLLKKGLGASALFAIYEDGFIEEPWGVEKEILTSKQNGTLKIFSINPRSKCKEVLLRLLSFFGSNEHKNFSLVQLKGEIREAHNCSSIILESLAKLGDVGDFLIKKSEKKLMIPYTYLGNDPFVDLPLNTRLPSFIQRQKVRTIPMSTQPPDEWGEAGLEAIMYDPGALSDIESHEDIERIEI